MSHPSVEILVPAEREDLPQGAIRVLVANGLERSPRKLSGRCQSMLRVCQNISPTEVTVRFSGCEKATLNLAAVADKSKHAPRKLCSSRSTTCIRELLNEENKKGERKSSGS